MDTLHKIYCEKQNRLVSISYTLRIIFLLLIFLSFQKSSYATLEEFSTKASWYSTECCKYNPTPSCPTASGESLPSLEARGVLFFASWDFDLGEKALICHKDKCVKAVCLDRGPAKRLVKNGRRIDLGKKLFEQLAPLKTGVITVKVKRT